MQGASGLYFGIYPLSAAGTPQGLATGPPDDFGRIRSALADLGPNVEPRTYLVDTQSGGHEAVLALADRYLDGGLLGHVVLGCLRDSGFDLDCWLDLVRTIVRRYGRHLLSLQITNEPNLSFMDGARSFTHDALVHGVVAAKDEAVRNGIDLDVGFGSVPHSPVAVPSFWEDLGDAGPEFAASVDFVGHNFYVDVFEEPLPLSAVPERVDETLRDLRTHALPAARIPATVPIWVTENGWPTGTNPLTGATRGPGHQAAVVDAVVRRVHRLRSELNISHYILFGLRDADSGKSDIFHQFGIVRDDYTPKAAYGAFKDLVQELGI